jgi:hypothetical protein
VAPARTRIAFPELPEARVETRITRGATRGPVGRWRSPESRS